MASSLPITFEAIRHFVVVPDRHYRVELHADSLRFIKTGSQFDGLSVEDRRATSDADSGASKAMLIATGIGVIVLSLALAFLTARMGWIVFGFYFLAAGGFILLFAGIFRPSKARVASGRDNFAIPLSQLDAVDWKPPARSGTPARLTLRVASDRPIKLSIPSEADYRVLQESVIPRLR